MVTGQLYSGIRVPSIRYRKDRSFGHLSLLDLVADVPKWRYTVSRFNLPSDLKEKEGSRACMSGIYKWQNSIVRSIPIAVVCMLDSSKNVVAASSPSLSTSCARRPLPLGQPAGEKSSTQCHRFPEGSQCP